jgi:alkylated DNA nucleotide flippase Atl1
MNHEEVSKESAGIWADLFRDLARAADRASTRFAGLLDEQIDEPEIRSLWGKKFLRLEGLGLERGMTTRDISAQAGMDDEPNADKALVQLAKNELVELVPGSSPKRWRLTRDKRRDRILRASRLIPRGKWTTYGDIAIAVAGNIRVARAVSRVAAKNPAFANPHRVLAKGGTIPPGWKDDEGKGPEECERRLTEEGVVLDDGHAPRELRVSHDEIRTGLEGLESAEDEA